LHDGFRLLTGTGDAGDEAAATDRHDHGIHIVERVHDLEADRALAGDDILVVVGMYERGARLLLETHGLVVRIVVGARERASPRHRGRRVFSTFMIGAPSGMQTMLLTPMWVAASATPWAWFPAEQAMMPLSSASFGSCEIL
jgi:hypothetical protein